MTAQTNRAVKAAILASGLTPVFPQGLRITGLVSDFHGPCPAVLHDGAATMSELLAWCASVDAIVQFEHDGTESRVRFRANLRFGVGLHATMELPLDEHVGERIEELLLKMCLSMLSMLSLDDAMLDELDRRSAAERERTP